jgi:hypothetical protein
VDKVVQDLMIVDHILTLCGRYGDLVGDSPNADRGVVIALNYKLLHLAYGILTTVWHMLGNVGDLRPYHHTVLVTQIVEILIVLIVSKADSVCAYLEDKLDILSVMLGKKCVAEAKSVLVTGNAAKGVGLTVKEEAELGINLEGANAEAGGYVVDNVAVCYKLSLEGVKVGVASAVPEVCALDSEAHGRVGGLGSEYDVLLLVECGVANSRALGELI